MANPETWIVCESAGRWTAALRLALARRQVERANRNAMPRIQEVRSLADLDLGVSSQYDALGFVEVSPVNLALVLEIVTQYARRNQRFVALLAGDLGGTSAADALTEAGAMCVVSAPRHIGTAIEIAERYSAGRSRAGSPNCEESIAEWAWTALPWQDA
jgi:hypothetical protein